MTTHGIDYGAIDGNHRPDFIAARKAGVSFCFRKLYQSPYGGDTGFEDEWSGLAAADIVRAAYIFPDVRSGAVKALVQVQGAARYLAACGGLRDGDMAPAMDVEFPGGHLPRPIADCVQFLEEFASAMFDVFGCWPILYTSARVYDGSDTDALHAPNSWLSLRCPLWVKTGYLHAAGGHANLAAIPTGRPRIPLAWAGRTSPGAWVNQWDGDQRGLPGMSSTVDLNRFLGLSRATATAYDAGRIGWVRGKLGVPTTNNGDLWGNDLDDALIAWQTSVGLVADGDIGPRSFARLSRLT